MTVEMSAEIENLQEIIAWIGKKNDEGQKAMKWTVADMKRTMVPTIKKEVQQVYNADAKAFKTANVKVVGTSLYELEARYSSTMLTPVHFGMQPKSAKNKRGQWKTYKKKARTYVYGTKPYTLTMEVLKGKRVTIGEYKQTRTRGSGSRPTVLMGSIPMHRKGNTPTPVEAFRTMSVSGMVASGRVAPQIVTRLNVKAGETLEKKLAQALGG